MRLIIISSYIYKDEYLYELNKFVKEIPQACLESFQKINK